MINKCGVEMCEILPSPADVYLHKENNISNTLSHTWNDRLCDSAAQHNLERGVQINNLESMIF